MNVPSFLSLQNEFKCIIGHKYLMQGNSQSGQNIIWFCQDLPTTHSYIDTGNGLIFTPVKNKLEALFRVLIGVTCNNVVIKPQLFDLTEMFGAGHEPATVAEFRQRFPNELYPYSPQCWLTSYKSAVVCKTKNLFDIHNLTAYTPETLPNGTAGVYNGVIISKGRIDDTTCSTGKTLRQLCPDLIVGETYTLNFETTVPSSVGGQYESIHLRGSDNWWRRKRKVITERDLSAVVYIYAETDGAVYITYNLQIEKGSTATSYVPYQHL